MPIIAYPYHVKHCGEYYAPNTPIEVSDVESYVAGGAVVIDSTPETSTVAEKPKAKRTYKKRGE